MKIFNDKQKDWANLILEKNHISPFSNLYPFEIKELAIIFAYYSAKLEGNSYSYIETDILLKEGFTSTLSFDNATEIYKIYHTFRDIADLFKLTKSIIVEEKLVLNIYEKLIDFSPFEKKKAFKNSNYQQQFTEILSQYHQIQNPLEKAVFIHCNLVKLQPFILSNNTISRFLENLSLMNSNIIPIFSTQEKDIIKYQNAMRKFCFLGDYTEYSEYFLTKKIDYLETVSNEKLLNL